MMMVLPVIGYCQYSPDAPAGTSTNTHPQTAGDFLKAAGQEQLAGHICMGASFAIALAGVSTLNKTASTVNAAKQNATNAKLWFAVSGAAMIVGLGLQIDAAVKIMKAGDLLNKQKTATAFIWNGNGMGLAYNF